MPAASRTASQRANSAAMNVPNSSGVEPCTTTPAATRRVRTASSARISLRVLLSLATTAARRASRCEYAVPSGDVVARQGAGFNGGGHVGESGKPVLAGDREGFDLTGLNRSTHRRDRIEQHIHLLAENRAKGLRRRTKRHVQHADTGGLFEKFGGQMLGGAKAGACEYGLAGIGLCDCDQFLRVAGREIRMATMTRLAVATSDTGSNAVNVS